MKNLFLCLASLLILSCSDEKMNESEKNIDFTNKTIQNASLEEKLNYKKEHLTILANIISQNLENETLKSKLFSAIDVNESSKFFLYEDLLKLIDIDTERRAFLQRSLNAFENLDGVNWKAALTVYKNPSNVQARSSSDEPLFFFVEQESNITK